MTRRRQPKAGRKLDARILDALGIEYVWRMREGWDRNDPPRHALWQRTVYELSDGRERITHSIAAEYSTSGGDALRLARDEMRSRGLYLTVVDLRQEGGGDAYRALFQTTVQTMGEATAKDLPHAIALAALDALDRMDRMGGAS